MCVNSDYLLISGDKADIVSIQEPNKKVSLILQAKDNDINEFEGKKNSIADIKKSSNNNSQN